MIKAFRIKRGRILKGAFSLAICCIMALSVYAAAFWTPEPKGATYATGGSIEDVTGKVDASALRESMFDMDKVSLNTVGPNEKRWVIVEFEGDSISDRYFSTGLSASMTLNEYSTSNAAEKLSKELVRAQNKVLSRIARNNIEFKQKYSYTLLSNAAAIEVKGKDISALKKIDGVRSVNVSELYSEPMALTENDAHVFGTGIYDTTDLDYSGKGMLVAVLDTGLDESHEAFRQPIDKTKEGGGEYDVVTKKDVADRIFTGKGGFSEYDSTTTVDDVYYSEKVPFAYDYADRDADVFPQYSSHGTHVSGIIAGGAVPNIKDRDGRPVTNKSGEELSFVGVAPNAQLAFFKVFTDQEFDETLGGAETVDIVAALEDCIKLDVDIINMSLGSSAGFSEASDEYMQKQIYGTIKAAGISLVVAASNDYSSGYGGVYGTNLKGSPDSATVGSPSTYEAALSVASIEGQKAPYLLGNPGTENESYAYFTEASDGYGVEQKFIDGLFERAAANGMTVTGDQLDIEYVVIPGYGKSFNYTGKNVTNKIALVSRGGEVTFQEKQEVAKDRGALGVVIYNNVSGGIRMSLGEDKNPIPACSITMDIAAGLVSGATNGSGIIRISKSQAAGPFMSEFSSWGPTPDLKLKPEITAHGGEIISAVSGGWSEGSGTSMAAPNMAGAMSLLLQHISDNESDLGVAGDRVGAVALANQLVMSTATIAENEFGDPYSPRKQGAGLANISNAVNTDAYIYINGYDGNVKDKTKIELGDDRQKIGEYNLEFYINNIGGAQKSYRIEVDTVTETLASDGLTVAERPKMLTDSLLTIDGAVNNIVTVEAGARKKVSVKVKLSDDTKDYLDTTFENGMYIEGFVRLVDQEQGEDAINLNVPWLAFYGDWYAAPMMDISDYELSAAMQDDSIEDRDKPQAQVRATTPLGLYWNDKYIMPLGSYLYVLPDGFKEIYSAEEKAAVSMFDEEGRRTIYELYGIYGGLIRGAKETHVAITDAATGESVFEEIQYNNRKGFTRGPSYVRLEYTPSENGLNNNREYIFSMVNYMDDLGDFDGGFDDERRAPGRGDTVEDEEARRNNTFTFKFTIDNEAPTLEDYSIRYVPYTENKQVKYRTYLDMEIYDNQFAQAVFLCYPSSATGFLELLTGDVLPVESERNSTTTVTVDISEYIESNEALYIQVEDYAMNSRAYKVSDFKPLKSAATFPESITFADGDSVSIAIGEHYIPEFSVTPVGATKNNLAWITSNSQVVAVKNGELYGLKEGNATVTVFCSDSPTGTLKQSINVTVTDEVKSGSAQVTRLKFEQIKDKEHRVVNPTNTTVEVNPGADFKLSVVAEPWYHASNIGNSRLQLAWSSSNESVATVTQNGTVATEKEGRAMITATLLLNGKPSIYTVSVTLEVGPEFVVSNGYLTKYHGRGGKVIIPRDLNVYYISEKAFQNNNNITELEISSPVIEIEYNAFNNMTKLERLVIPESVDFIQNHAFAGCTALERIDLRSNFIMIGSYAFSGCTALTEINNISISDMSVDNKTASILELSDDQLTKSAPRITSLKNRAFSDCTALKSIDLTQLRAAESYVFSGCTALEKITVSKDTQFSENMFYGCTKLTTVEFTDIEDYSQIFARWSRSPFTGCGIEQIILPGGVTVHTDAAGNIFADAGQTVLLRAAMTGLTGGLYVLPASVTAIGRNAFAGDPNLEKIDFNGAVVTEIGDYAFSGSGIKEITLPASVAVMGQGVFLNCAALESADISAAVFDTLPANTFMNTALADVTVNPDALIRIGNRAFANTALTAIDLRNTAVTELGDAVFYNCSSLVTAALPALTSIGSLTFGATSASALTSVSFAEGATVLGRATFMSTVRRNAFINLSLPQSLITATDTVYALTFMNCSALTTLPFTGLVAVGDGAFYGCTSLSSVNISGVREIGATAFYDCKQLLSVDLSSVETVGEEAFKGCSRLASVNLSAAVTLGASAFSESGVSSVTWGADIHDIGQYAFYKTAFSGSVALPSAVQSIGTGAFTSIAGATAYAFGGGASKTANGKYSIENGVLMSVTANGGKRLEAYPAARDAAEYAVPADVNMIGASAFEGASVLKTVSFGENLRLIGAKAFFASAVTTYVFDTLNAPVLESEFIDVDVLPSSDPLYRIYSWRSYNGLGEDKFYANFYTYMGFLLYPRESGVRDPGMTVKYPANAKGFDNYVWSTFFTTHKTLSIKAEEQTLLALQLIEDLPAAAVIEALKTAADQAAARQSLVEYKAAAKAARSAYKEISSAAQVQEFITNYDKLLQVEAAIRDASGHFGQAVSVEKLTVSVLPTKLVYTEGEYFEPAGITIKVLYQDGSEIDITDGFTYYTDPLTTETERITMGFGGKTCTVNISVSASTDPDPDPKPNDPGCKGCGSVASAAVFMMLACAFIVVRKRGI